MTRVLLAILVFLHLFPASSRAIEYVEGQVKDYREFLDRKKTELKEVKARINAERAKIKKEAAKERVTTKYIQQLERELDVTKKELQVFDNNIEVFEAGIRDLDARIASAEREIDERKESVGQILRRQYKNGNRDYYRILFSSGSFGELVRRYKFVKILGKKNLETVRNYRNTIERLAEDKETLGVYAQELRDLRAEKEKEWKRFKNERWQRHVTLKNIRQNIAKSRKMVGELEKAASNLNKLMDRLEAAAELSDKGAEEAFTKNRRKFPWPVDDGKLLAKYGYYNHPKFRTKVFNRGLHIAAPAGRPVYSIFGGVVKYADWFEGYGKMVIVYHGGGYFTVYGHLSRILVSEGEKVSLRQAIGNVGDTESFYGYELYFEIRKKSQPLDPLKYLRRL